MKYYCIKSVSHCSRADIVIRGNIMAVYCLPKSYFVNLFYLFFYRSMHLYISVSYFVCGVSLTHSLGLFKPHLAWHKYIINCHLHWMPLKLESFSRENDVLTHNCDIYCECARGCDVSACAAGNKRTGSESTRRETDQPVTDPGRSCDKLSESDHWPVSRCISNNNNLVFSNLLLK